MEEKEFDQFADNYDDILTDIVIDISGQESSFFSEYKIEEIKSRSIAAADATWLDFGCGIGNTAKYIKKHFPDAKYYGIDVSGESIEVASKNYAQYGDSMHFKVYDGFHVPFDDDTFDIIFIACVLHHIMPEDRPAIMGELKRVLKPTGRIVIFEHNPYNPATMNVVRNCPFDENAVLLTPPICKKLLEECRFRDLKKCFVIFVPRKGILKKIVGIEKLLFWLPMGGQYYYTAGK